MEKIYNWFLLLHYFTTTRRLPSFLKGYSSLLIFVFVLIGLNGIGQTNNYLSFRNLKNKSEGFLKLILILVVIAGMSLKGIGQNVSATWGANGSGSWYTAGSWAAGAYAGSQSATPTANANIATFTSVSTATTFGMAMTAAGNSLNLGAISIDNTRTTTTNIGNSSTSGSGVLRLYGATVNGVANVIVRHDGTGALTLQAVQGTMGMPMGIVLSNVTDNVINTDASGGVTISSIISGTGQLTKAGSGTGVLTLSNTGNTYGGKTFINSGLINISDEGAFGANPGGPVSNQITLDGGGIQTSATLLNLSSNRGITLGAGGGTFDALTNTSVIATQNALSGSGNLTKTGPGKLQLNYAGGNTVVPTNNITVNGGTLQISTNQTLNNLTLQSGTLLVDNGVTLIINGTLEYFNSGTITLSGTGSIKYGSTGTLKYSGTSAITTSLSEWPVSSPPLNVISNNSAGVNLSSDRTITGNLALNLGLFTINPAIMLDLNGASMTSAAGSIAGSATSVFTVRGTTGGTITLPAATVTLGVINVNDTRTLALNGTNNLTLKGTLSIAKDATFDNGGASQITGTTGSVNITGRFITRGTSGFVANSGSGSIPDAPVTLNALSTIEYGLASGVAQLVSGSTAVGQPYYNITFSGSGSKTLNNLTDVNTNGTVTITGSSVTVDASSNNLASASANTTNFTMDGGILLLGTTSTLPNMGGTYNLTGGILRYVGSGNPKINSKPYQNIEVTGSNVSNSGGNITLNASGTFVIKSGGIFTINADAIVGTASSTVTVESGGIFKCGNALGFNGPAVGLNSPAVRDNIGIIDLKPGSLVEYSRSNPPLVSGDQVITNTTTYQNLTLSGNAGVKTAPSGTLIVQGNLVKSGTTTFLPNGGTVLLNGGTQSFAGLPYHNLLLDNAGTKTLSGSASIEDSIRIGNPATDPATILELGVNDITLKSVDTSTAKVATVSSAATISYSATGRFVVERYFKSLRSWRVITLPVTAKGTSSNITIFDTWQNAGTNTAGKGMFVTGPGASSPMPGADGLDWSAHNNYSLKRFSHNTYINVNKTKDSLTSGNLADTSVNIGYFAFVRGDRSRSPDNTVVPNTNKTTLSGKGKIQTGRQTFHLTTDSLNSFTLIGNPYACPVDFSLVTKNNVYPSRFIVYDPTYNSVGVFIIMENSLGAPTVFKPINIPSSTQNNFIQSGQGFFVQPNDISQPADLVFNETNKSVTGNNLTLFRPLGDLGQNFNTILNKQYDDSSVSVADGVHVQLDDAYSDGIDIADAMKFDNIGENLAIIRHERALAVERRPVFTVNDTLFYRFTNTAQRNYQFEFSANNIAVAQELAAYLEDNYTHAATIINLSGSTKVNFTINSDSASADPDRFRLVFKSAGGPLPVTFSNIKAWKQGNNIAVEWTVQNEINVKQYEVEKSIDGTSFIKVNTTLAIGANRSNTNYNWLDQNIVQGNNYYRIRSIDRNGKAAYSRIVNVKTGRTAPGISIYPNPVKDGVIGLQFNNMPSGDYNLRLINNLGQTILSRRIASAGSSATQTIVPNTSIAKGIYQLEITYPDKTTTVLKVII